MANALFGAYKQVLLGDAAVTGFTAPNLETGDIRTILFDDAAGAPNQSTWQDLVDVPAGDRIAVSADMSTKAVTMTGTPPVVTWDADDVTFSAVTGDQAEDLIIYSHTGVEGTSLLMVHFEGPGGFSSGMPVTPNGGNIVVQWNASGIFTW